MPSTYHAALSLVIVALVAAGVAGLLITATFPLLRRYALARPNARSSHVVPTAQGGGAGVIAATLLVLWGALLVGDGRLANTGTIGLPALAIVTLVVIAVAVMGAIDDIRPLPVLPRLLVQVGAAGVLVATVPAGLRALPLLPVVLESAVLTVGLVWFINLTNFMDGIDELTVVEFVPIATTLALLGPAGVLPAPAAVIAAALAGALVGFWPWNRHVARLFLGDVGSLAIGALTGWLLILLAARGYFAAALILPLYYLADATLTLYRRWRRRERLSDAHRSHYYQRATTIGRTVPEITRTVLAANITLAVIAVATIAIGRGAFDILALGAAIGIVGMLLAHLVPAHGRGLP